MSFRNPLLATLLVMMVGCLNAAEQQPVQAQSVEQLGPQQIVNKVAQETLRDLEANRAEYRKDPQKLRNVVDKNMLPYFDTEYMARSVLAVHWKIATAEQRQRFITAFYRSLLRNYSDALLDFNSDRLRILPLQKAADSKLATVRSEIVRDNGTPVAVSYQLHQTPQGWKAFDVSIEGVSYLRTYKRDFATEIQDRGLEAMIKRLESLAAAPPVAAAKN